MGIFKKIFGICETVEPGNSDSWDFDGEKISLYPEKIPELNTKGSAIRLEGKGLKTRILVLRNEENEFHAFENRCTHMGRRLDPGIKPGSVKCCSVSGSVFDLDGNPKKGIATKPVKKFKIIGDKNRLEIKI